MKFKYTIINSIFIDENCYMKSSLDFLKLIFRNITKLKLSEKIYHMEFYKIISFQLFYL